MASCVGNMETPYFMRRSCPAAQRWLARSFSRRSSGMRSSGNGQTNSGPPMTYSSTGPAAAIESRSAREISGLRARDVLLELGRLGDADHDRVDHRLHDGVLQRRLGHRDAELLGARLHLADGLDDLGLCMSRSP